MTRKENHREYIEWPIEATINILGGKWKAVILFRLSEQTFRFCELQRQLTKISQRTLTNQLRQLESDGLINRKVYPVAPPKVEYSLTDLGRTLCPLLDQMYAWGMEKLIEPE